MPHISNPTAAPQMRDSAQEGVLLQNGPTSSFITDCSVAACLLFNAVPLVFGLELCLGSVAATGGGGGEGGGVSELLATGNSFTVAKGPARLSTASRGQDAFAGALLVAGALAVEVLCFFQRSFAIDGGVHPRKTFRSGTRSIVRSSRSFLMPTKVGIQITRRKISSSFKCVATSFVGPSALPRLGKTIMHRSGRLDP